MILLGLPVAAVKKADFFVAPSWRAHACNDGHGFSLRPFCWPLGSFRWPTTCRRSSSTATSAGGSFYDGKPPLPLPIVVKGAVVAHGESLVVEPKSLRNIPAGERTFRLWHERCGFITSAEIDGRKTSWARGLVTVKISADKAAELGTAAIEPRQFE